MTEPLHKPSFTRAVIEESFTEGPSRTYKAPYRRVEWAFTYTPHFRLTRRPGQPGQSVTVTGQSG